MSPKVDEAYKINKRNRILDAAQRCFKRNGYEKTTVNEIMAEARVSAGGLYNYFESKLDIYLSLAERNLRENLKTYERVLTERCGAWSKLRDLIRMSMLYFREGGKDEFTELYLIEFLPASMGNEWLRQQLVQRNRQIFDILRTVLREGVETGEFRPLDHDAVAALIVAAGDGVRLHDLTMGTLVDVDRMYRAFLDNIGKVVLVSGAGSDCEG